MKFLVLIGFLFITCNRVCAQQKLDHLIVVTTDGLRWQEVFGGMDSSLVVQRKYNQNDSAFLVEKFGGAAGVERRKKLLPFFWSTFANNGQIWGNRASGNFVNVANPYWFSYPGYSEIFTGYADTAINSNGYPSNPHKTVLDHFNALSAYKGRVAAFTAWEAFNRILAEDRSGFPVIAAFDTVPEKTPVQRTINTMLRNSYKPWGTGECLDVFTHTAAMDFLKSAHPAVLYISYGETDEWAHAGQYRDYLNAAHQVDAWLQELWMFIQQDARYKNRTAVLVTTDHGRGTGASWTDHGQGVAGANQIWFGILAPGLPATGAVQQPAQLYQDQFGQTLANLLGTTFTAPHPVGASLLPLLKNTDACLEQLFQNPMPVAVGFLGRGCRCATENTAAVSNR